MTISTIDGVRMSPVPRSTEASVLTIQMPIEPAKSTCEKVAASFNTAAAAAEKAEKAAAE